MSGRHYLDHASTSPLRPAVKDALVAWSADAPTGDPARPFEEGRIVRDAIEAARDELALLLDVRQRQVIFTGSGTEAINAVNASFRSASGAQHTIALSAVEHAAVRKSAEHVAEVVDVPADAFGRIDLDFIHTCVNRASPPVLVHCQFANHEVGTLQPIEQVIALCHEAGVAVHVDACSAFGQLPINVGALDADFVSISAHKAGGPTGIGALILKRNARLSPFLFGGDQERARRAGFENVLGIIGFGALASELRYEDFLSSQEAATRQATNALSAGALSTGGVITYGDTTNRLPHIVCFGVEGVEAEGVVLGLDQRGFSVHSGSACAGEAFEPSPVLQAMGVDANHSLRLSAGWSTTDEDVAAFSNAFHDVVSSLRTLGPTEASN